MKRKYNTVVRRKKELVLPETKNLSKIIGRGYKHFYNDPHRMAQPKLKIALGTNGIIFGNGYKV